MRIQQVLVVFLCAVGAVVVTSLAAGPAAAAPPQGRSPLTVFSPGTVLIPAAPTYFTQKHVDSAVVGVDTWFGSVLVPAGSFVQQAKYTSACSAPECINLNVLTSQQNAQIHDEVLNRGTEVSRLDPQNYLAQRGSAQRQVWRWGSLGDSLPISLADVDLYRAAGVSIIPTLVANNPAFRDPAFPGNGGCMTADFTNVFDPAFGYSQVYFDWVTRLVTAYADIMPMIVIENEVDQDGNTWCEPVGVREGYRKMVVTAKYAIRQAGVNVLVADSGMLGGGWIRMAAVDLIADRATIVSAGQTPSAELEHQILELISQIRTSIPLTLGGNVDWAAIESGAAGVESPTVQNAREVIRLLNANVIDPDLGEPALDVYNFHYHQTSSALPAVAQYVRSVFDTDGSPLINNEMGLLADKDNKTLAANNTSLLAFTEFMPVSSYFPTGEIEGTGGALAFGTLVPIAPREELLATEDLVKKFIHAFGNGVSDVTYYGFNEIKTSTYQVADGQPYDFFQYTWLNFSASISEDKVIVPQNFRAVLNVRALFDGTILSSSHAVAGPVESYEFQLPNKTVTAWWVQSYVSNIGLSVDVDVSAKIAAGALFYDMEGFEIVPLNGNIQVGLSPVFAEDVSAGAAPCAYLGTFATSQLDAFLAALINADPQIGVVLGLHGQSGTSVDADLEKLEQTLASSGVVPPGDGLPDLVQIALIEHALCNNLVGVPDFSATHDVHLANINVAGDFLIGLGTPAEIQLGTLLKSIAPTLSALMGSSQESQDTVQAMLTLLTGAPIGGTFSVYGVSAKTASEPFSGTGDIDGDGIDNATEYAAVIAAGGSVDDALFAILNNTGSSALPVGAALALGALAAAMALAGSSVLRRKK